MTDTKTEIGQTVLSQLGNKALYMIGAKNYCLLENGIQFSIMRNAKRVNKIVIKLNGLDLYDVEFWKIYGSKFTKLAEENNVYNDQLHKIIETNTELYTKLF